METVDVIAEPGLLIAAEGAELQFYMQKYPFLQGPDGDLNRTIRQKLPSITQIRRPSKGACIDWLSNTEAVLAPEAEARARALLRQVGMSEAEVERTISEIAWKFVTIPVETRSILDVGCGGGIELVFLRAVAPDAQIFAVDWMYDLPSALVEAVGVDFRKCDVFSYLETTAETFDLVFSNHVLEHMYAPDRILAILRNRVGPGGNMIACLPLDGQGACIVETKARLTGSKPLSWVYFGSIDIAHPWKTTPADLGESIINAGFSNVRMVQRAEHLTVVLATDESGLAQFRKRGQYLQKLFLSPVKAATAAIFGNGAPYWAMRLFFAFERRIWFGANRFKNAEAPEILVIAG